MHKVLIYNYLNKEKYLKNFYSVIIFYIIIYIYYIYYIEYMIYLYNLYKV